MADVVTIPQNLFYIIIAFIAVIGLIVALMQWRRVRESQTNVMFLEKQAELRKNNKIDYLIFVKQQRISCIKQVIFTVK